MSVGGWGARLVRVLTLGVPLVVASGAAPRDPPAREIHELRIQVDGSTIRALCTDGSRQIVLLHGEASTADTWRPVLRRLDSGVGACAYDRRGYGESDPAPEVRGWFELVDELRRIHLALGFDKDYVLVGHSLGGLYARLFVADRPIDVAGLVLVDPAHEDMPSRVKIGMPRDEWEGWVEARMRPNTDGVTELTVGERARRSRLPDVPVTIITAAIRRDGGGWDARFVNEAARQVHASILRGITSARHIPAERSRHDIQLDEPGLVAQEILRVLRASRR